MKKKSVMAIIPARGGSKGIPRKNMKPLGGRPLLYYTVNAAIKSGLFDKIIVSTDDVEIDKVSIKYGAQVVKRPKRISRDTSSTEQAVVHALRQLKKNESYKPDVVVLLQPTSPLRNEMDIVNAYKIFTKNRFDSLLSVAQNRMFLWEKGKNGAKPINYNYKKRPRRQDMKTQFLENGAIYITKYEILNKYNNRLGGKIGLYMMEEVSSIDIDSQLEFSLAEQIIRKGRV